MTPIDKSTYDQIANGNGTQYGTVISFAGQTKTVPVYANIDITIAPGCQYGGWYDSMLNQPVIERPWLPMAQVTTAPATQPTSQPSQTVTVGAVTVTYVGEADKGNGWTKLQFNVTASTLRPDKP